MTVTRLPMTEAQKRDYWDRMHAQRRRQQEQARLRYLPGDVRFPYRKSTKGRALCRVCGTGITPPRRTFCSDRCVKRYNRSMDPAWRAKWRLHAVHGACEGCGFKITWLRHILKLAKKHFDEQASDGHPVIFSLDAELIQAGIIDGRRHYFEMDHIRPVSLGGGSEDSNLRLLCIPCHKAETKKLAGVLAKSRRREKKAREHQQNLLREDEP